MSVDQPLLPFPSHLPTPSPLSPPPPPPLRADPNEALSPFTEIKAPITDRCPSNKQTHFPPDRVAGSAPCHVLITKIIRNLDQLRPNPKVSYIVTCREGLQGDSIKGLPG